MGVYHGDLTGYTSAKAIISSEKTNDKVYVVKFSSITDTAGSEALHVCHSREAAIDKIKDQLLKVYAAWRYSYSIIEEWIVDKGCTKVEIFSKEDHKQMLIEMGEKIE